MDKKEMKVYIAASLGDNKITNHIGNLLTTLITKLMIQSKNATKFSSALRASSGESPTIGCN